MHLSIASARPPLRHDDLGSERALQSTWHRFLAKRGDEVVPLP